MSDGPGNVLLRIQCSVALVETQNVINNHCLIYERFCRRLRRIVMEDGRFPWCVVVACQCPIASVKSGLGNQQPPNHLKALSQGNI